jgi:hypothetical protein
MTAQAHVFARAVSRRGRWSSERLFYTGFAVAIAVAVVLGFARTFFFRAWYPEWARVHGAPETFFYIHGTVFAAWLLLLIAQTSLARPAAPGHAVGRAGADCLTAAAVLAHGD